MRQLPGYTIKEQDLMIREQAKRSLALEVNRRHTICEQFRFLYDTVYQMEDGEVKEDLTEKLIDAFLMAKKMAARLNYYFKKYGYKTGTGHRGLNIQMLEHNGRRKYIRRQREV